VNRICIGDYELLESRSDVNLKHISVYRFLSPFHSNPEIPVAGSFPSHQPNLPPVSLVTGPVSTSLFISPPASTDDVSVRSEKVSRNAFAEGTDRVDHA
jgi:hypothetical protein